MRRPALTLLLAFALLGNGTGVALGAPGDLDTGFGNGGRLIFDLGGDDFAFDVLVQPDGKIVTVGGGGVPRGFRITRFNPDGSADPGFGEGGTAAPDFSEREETAVSAALAPGGKIVIVGTMRSELQSSIIVARLLADGRPDPTFGDGGALRVDATVPSAGRELAVAADGGIVVAGERAGVGGAVGGNGIVVARLTAAGAVDPAFNGGAPLLFEPDPGGLVVFQRAMALLPGGDIMLAFRTSGDADADLGLARLTTSGAVDPGFAGGAAFRRYDLGGDEMPVRMALQPDGKLVVAGRAGSGDLSALARFTAGGALEEGFGSNGVAGVALGGNALQGVAVQANGKLIGFGGNDAGNGIAMRVQPGGTLDTTFAGDGVAQDVFGGGDDSANAGALQRNGAVLAAGGSAFDHALARLEGDGAGAGGGPAQLPGGSEGGGGRNGGGRGATKAPRCGGKRATIVGSARKDRLKGTRRPDVIVGLGGSDRIAGGGGKDLICGGSGDDRLDGGAGDDRLFGESGEDKLGGGAGNDKVDGGPGNDALGGGPGRDTLAGQSGRDRLSGGPGKGDRCAGGAGRDRASCERGA